MNNVCERCKHEDTCTKIIGAMFGYCNSDFEPRSKNVKTYRVGVIDWNEKNGKIISERYIKSLAEVRRQYKKNWHYSRNGKCWIAYEGDYEYMAVEC